MDSVSQFALKRVRPDFYQEKRDNFLYIALELCSASLSDVIERPQDYQDLTVGFDRKKALYQITAGLKHLHGLKIIHRDLKPQYVHYCERDGTI